MAVRVSECVVDPPLGFIRRTSLDGHKESSVSDRCTEGFRAPVAGALGVSGRRFQHLVVVTPVRPPVQKGQDQ